MQASRCTDCTHSWQGRRPPTKAVLDEHGVLWGEQHALAIHRRLEGDALLCDFRQVEERHHLCVWGGGDELMHQ
jgi:hypothetical protein